MIINNLQKRILSSIVLLPLVLYSILAGSYYLVFITLIFFLLASYEWNKMVKNLNLKFFGTLFLFFSFFTFYKIPYNYLSIFVLMVCVSTDIGGYVIGKFLKGPKLTKISPNKTFAGMLGSYFFSLIFLFFFLNWINHANYIEWIIVTFLISTMSQVGDILISYFKRLSNIKDTGKIIPGHGGLLDRIDGMIFAFPTFYLILLTNYFSI